MPSVRLKFKSESFNIQIDFEKPLHELFEYIGEIIAINKLHCRLIVRGKSYFPGSEDGLVIGDIIAPNSIAFLMSSSEEDVEWVKRVKPDPLVKGFKEEEQDEIRRIARTKQLAETTPWDSVQHKEFKFNRFEVLYKRTSPTPFDAEKLLMKLASDPGIVEIMSSRRFVVGTLCELDPEDADVEQAVKGEADRCLLGWNRNFGERIALRLRTDDFKSFRKYDSIINTLIHEITHNVIGPHNDQFWALFNELKTVYGRVHGERNGAKPLSSIPVAAERSLSAREAVSVTGQTASSRGGSLGGATKASDTEELRAARLKRLDKALHNRS